MLDLSEVIHGNDEAMKASLLMGLGFLVCLCAGCSKTYPITSGGRTASAWADVLRAPNEAVALRRKAATKLGPLVLIDDAAMPALLLALQDKDAGVRRLAARSLGIYSGPRAEEVLPSLLNLKQQEKDRTVQEAAATAIERMSNLN
jgi:hypothetical protein